MYKNDFKISIPHSKVIPTRFNVVREVTTAGCFKNVAKLKNGGVPNHVGLGGVEGTKSYAVGLIGVFYSEGCLTPRSIAQRIICGGCGG